MDVSARSDAAHKGSRLRLIHVISGAVSPADGPSVTAVRICTLIEEMGADVSLASIESPAKALQPEFVVSFPALIGPVGSSPGMKRWLRTQLSRRTDTILHCHGLWRMPILYASRLARETGAPLVVSPHGALASRSLAIRRYRKLVFGALVQRSALQAAACFHATCESEYEDIRRAGFTQPICLLRHGVDLPRLEDVERTRRRLVFVGRVYPQKGVETLLRAWKAVEASFPDWDLEVVGAGDLDSFAALAERLGIVRAWFRGPLYGLEKARAFQRADLFVLPSESENFGIAIAEALAAGTPVIVTRGTPWKDVEGRAAGWCIDFGVESLVAALRRALAIPRGELDSMGSRGREWMRTSFAWQDVGNQWSKTYRWLTLRDSNSRPPWIRAG